VREPEPLIDWLRVAAWAAVAGLGWFCIGLMVAAVLA
jgi:hypothetical protein